MSEHTTKLESGAVKVILDLNFLELFGDDRELVCGIIDLIQAYEKKHQQKSALEAADGDSDQRSTAQTDLPPKTDFEERKR
jgi:hypothetical protein